jgi:hypothetical protein
MQHVVHSAFKVIPTGMAATAVTDVVPSQTHSRGYSTAVVLQAQVVVVIWVKLALA